MTEAEHAAIVNERWRIALDFCRWVAVPLAIGAGVLAKLAAVAPF